MNLIKTILVAVLVLFLGTASLPLHAVDHQSSGDPNQGLPDGTMGGGSR